MHQCEGIASPGLASALGVSTLLTACCAELQEMHVAPNGAERRGTVAHRSRNLDRRGTELVEWWKKSLPIAHTQRPYGADTLTHTHPVCRAHFLFYFEKDLTLGHACVCVGPASNVLRA
jgi:hypothetical protein